MAKRHILIDEIDHQNFKKISKNLKVPMYFILEYVIQNDFDSLLCKEIQEAYKKHKSSIEERRGRPKKEQ